MHVHFFYGQSGQVPCWMFIMWISQMMALLDKPEGSTVHHILTELAETYPQVNISSACIHKPLNVHFECLNIMY